MAPTSPFRAALDGVIREAWARAPRYLPETLQICRCPHCIPEQTFREMLATPLRDLPAGLIREYSASAHGTPGDPADLTALLPRYLELMADGVSVHSPGVGTDLRRFGAARAERPPALPPDAADQMDRWARLMILDTGWAEATGARPPIRSLSALVEILIVGGIPLPAITSALSELFARPDIGTAALRSFLAQIGDRFRYKSLGYWAVAHHRPETASPLSDWLNNFLSDLRTVETGTDPGQPFDLGDRMQAALDQAGRITARRIG